MGFFSSLLISEEIIKTASSGIYDGVDKAFYTKEEQTEDDIKRLDAYLKYIDSSKPQNLARRWISLVVTIVWAITVLVGFIVGLIFADDKTAFILDFIPIMVVPPFVTIIGFYFGKQLLGLMNRGQ